MKEIKVGDIGRDRILEKPVEVLDVKEDYITVRYLGTDLKASIDKKLFIHEGDFQKIKAIIKKAVNVHGITNDKEIVAYVMGYLDGESDGMMNAMDMLDKVMEK